MGQQVEPRFTAAGTERPQVAETELRAGALRFPEVLMQGITTIAPAIAVLYSFQFIVGLAGLASPWVYIVAMAIVMMTAVSLSALARAFPSAGSYYTFVSRTVSPRAGFMAAWLYILYSPPVSGVILAFQGWVLQTELDKAYGINIPWWVWLLVLGSIVTFAIYRGIELSGKALLIFGGAEIVLVLILSLWGLGDPGPGGLTLSPFNPGNATGLNGFYLAVVFSIFAYTGWEGVAPIAEESENPRRNVPRAIYLSIVILGGIFIICFWGLLVGWGVDDLKGLADSKELPPLVLAHRFWHGAWVIILLALLNSTLAVSISASTVSTRIWYAMGRSGSLPKAFAKVHPKYQTPINALHLQTAFLLVVGLGVGNILGPDEIWFWMGIVITLSVVVIYVLANLGSFLYFSREKRDEFNPIMHAVFPLISSAALIWLFYKTVHPFPQGDFKWTVWTVLIWIVLGLIVLAVMRMRGHEEWLLKAGAAVEDRPETDEELAHRPAF